MEADQESRCQPVATTVCAGASVLPELQGKKGRSETGYKVYGKASKLLLRATTTFHFQDRVPCEACRSDSVSFSCTFSTHTLSSLAPPCLMEPDQL